LTNITKSLIALYQNSLQLRHTGSTSIHVEAQGQPYRPLDARHTIRIRASRRIMRNLLLFERPLSAGLTSYLIPLTGGRSVSRHSAENWDCVLFGLNGRSLQPDTGHSPMTASNGCEIRLPSLSGHPGYTSKPDIQDGP
jgi:hypothetical protein